MFTAKQPSTQISKKEFLWTGLIFALVTLIPTAVFWHQLPCSDDTLTHFYRIVQIDLNLQNGVPFLQWGPDFLRGYGYNVLAFYAPVSYWLVEAIHLFGFDFGVAMQIANVLTLWLLGWGGYALARQFLSPLGAFVAGVAYLFAPYILYDAIQRGTLPETLALALAPWALAAGLRAMEKTSARAITLAVFLFVLLILAHNVVPLFALGLFVLLALAKLERPPGNLWRGLFGQLRPFLLILIFSLGITLFFWLPGLVELKDTQSRQAEFPFRQWPSYEQHILPVNTLFEMPDDPADPNLINPPIVRALSATQAILAIFGIIALIWYPASARRRQLIILVLVTITAVFFSSQPSFWWWNNLRLLNFIHLPVRFLGLASLGIAIFCGVAVDQLVRWFNKQWQTAVILIPAALIVSITGWAWLYPHYCPVPQNPDRLTLAQSTTWDRWFAEAQAETLPRWVQELPPEDGLMAQYQDGGDINRLILPDTATLTNWQAQPAHDTYQLTLESAEQLTYQTIYFPGWQAHVDGELVPIIPSANQGLITVNVPAGNHELTLKFNPTPLRLITLLISLLTSIALIIWAIRTPSPHPPRSPAPHLPIPLLLITAATLILAKFIVIDHATTPIRADRLHDGQLQGVPYPTHINFGDEFIHLGYKGDAEFDADEAINFTQYWTPLRGIGVPYGFTLQVVDDAGTVWHTTPGRPFSYTQFPSTESWQVGQYVRDAYAIELLPGTPPGMYSLETAVFRRDIDQSLIPQNGTSGSAPDRAHLGTIQLQAGDWKLNEQSAQVQTFQPTPVQNLAGLSLAGWTLPDIIWRSGEEAVLDLLWQADNFTTSEPVTAELWLQDESGERVTDTAVTLGSPHYPTTTWPKDAIVRDKINWRIPPQLKSGTYTVQLTLADQNIKLGQWQIDAPSRTFVQPEFAHPTDFATDFAQLIGFTLATQSSALSPQHLILFWHATAETDTSYRVFVHLLDENGSLVTQSDAIPAQWTRPTIGWVSGEFIIDQHTLTIPDGIAPGNYQLHIGLYDPITGIRLGETELGTISVPENAP